MSEGKELLSWAVLCVGICSPVATVLLWFGGVRARLKAIETHIKDCRMARETEEKTLHDRVTTLAKTVEYLKGRFNGHAAKE